jgi:hypothetical protein
VVFYATPSHLRASHGGNGAMFGRFEEFEGFKWFIEDDRLWAMFSDCKENEAILLPLKCRLPIVEGNERV